MQRMSKLACGTLLNSSSLAESWELFSHLVSPPPHFSKHLSNFYLRSLRSHRPLSFSMLPNSATCNWTPSLHCKLLIPAKISHFVSGYSRYFSRFLVVSMQAFLKIGSQDFFFVSLGVLKIIKSFWSILTQISLIPL